MNPQIETQLISHLESLQLQLWIFGGLTMVIFVLVTYLARSNWERVEKVLEANTRMIQIHDTDLAVLKSGKSVGEHFETAADTIADAIHERRERRTSR